MTAKFQRESLEALQTEGRDLLASHYLEIAHYTDIPLDIDWQAYAATEEAGRLRVFTARTAAGEMCGYAVFIVARNPHYRSSLQANQDVLYVAREHRRGGTGAGLIRFCEMVLRGENVQAVYHHAKTAHPALGKVLERMGYEHVDSIYAKRLDK